MKISPLVAGSLAGLLSVACADLPATGTDSAGSSSSTSAETTDSSSTAAPTSGSEPTTVVDPTTVTSISTSDATTGSVEPTTGSGFVCGDGIVDPGEECDDGPDNADTGSCTVDCAHNVCGDGKVGPGEGCDDGNDIDGDGCTNACAPSTCGDGIVAPTEGCDDGNADDSDACTSACTPAVCSDGFLQPGLGEQCDDGPDNADEAACTTSCQHAVCGDGHVWTVGGSEECDDGANNGPGKACNLLCLLNSCGDGDPGPGEQCDDGDLDNGDGCSAACELEACGNQVVDPGEECDDGQDGDPDDGCTDACKLPACGDGLVQASLAEACDLGGSNSDSGACTLACKTAVCGDGLVYDQVEQCDDGVDNGAGKACKGNCTANICGDGDQGPGEACDDGNPNNDDGCTNVCKLPTCGDGFVQPGEECDLGPGNDNTGACTLACQWPACGDGHVQAGEVCDDGNLADGDACSSDCQQQLEVLHVYAGELNSCVLVTGGRVKCWGRNGSGQLGLGDTANRGDEPGEMGANLPYVDLGPGLEVVDLALGSSHVCALFAGGSIKCWGSNSYGQLGQGDTADRGDQPGEMGAALPFVDVGADDVVDLSAGGSFTCALRSDGRLKCWGWNSNGELGQGNTNDRGDNPGEMGANVPHVNLGAGKLVTVPGMGRHHSCALLTGGAIKCWGSNVGGALGVGDNLARGDSPGEMGDALLAVDVTQAATKLAVAYWANCAVLADQSLRCWGSNTHGQLATGDTLARGDQPGELGAALPVVDLGGTVVSLVGGHTFFCARLQGGATKCWGRNTDGNLGLGDTQNRGDQPGEMGNSLPPVDLGTGKTAVELASRWLHTCARLDDGTVKCWGRNNNGELGLGDIAPRGDQPGEMGDNLPAVELF
ncbi:DUF4215 domain-containing protein [Nannocystis radixulma]|uniref:DUF4215 domain-containing protein n=1 Tax=Nannocystis radixulma TaxID=2995305 RepID=A0ABT5B801_9BACT|nr:DUF4215 domain-containing protein [Nannocystis radixulma]MDC0669217.1 DUF4215 domain-containing protein [Nannocystis radixulma]